MKNMPSFDFRRFTMLLGHELAGNWRRHLREFLVFYVVFLACIGSVFYVPSRYGIGPDVVDHWTYPDEATMFESAVWAVSIAFSVLLVYGVSLTFSHLYTRQQRIAWLMLPATNLEKFLARVLVYSVLWSVALLVALVLADVTRMLVFPLFGHGYSSLLPELERRWRAYVEDFFDSGLGHQVQIVLSYVTLLTGSALFRRYALVKTAFGLFLASLLILLIADMGRFGNLLFLDNVTVQVWNVVLIAGGLWLSWRQVSHMQVIPRHNSLLKLRKRKEA